MEFCSYFQQYDFYIFCVIIRCQADCSRGQEMCFIHFSMYLMVPCTELLMNICLLNEWTVDRWLNREATREVLVSSRIPEFYCGINKNQLGNFRKVIEPPEGQILVWHVKGQRLAVKYCLTIKFGVIIMARVNAEKFVRLEESYTHEDLPIVRFFTSLTVLCFLESEKIKNQITLTFKVTWILNRHSSHQLQFQGALRRTAQRSSFVKSFTLLYLQLSLF